MKKTETLLTPLLAAALFLAGCAQETDIQDEEKLAVQQWQEPIVEPPPEPSIAYVGDRVFFDYDRTTLRPDAIATIERQVAWLKHYPTFSIMVEGHADERGTREYNLGLGCRRAVAMREALIVRGISPERLGTISYGKERPAVLGANEDAWSQNRRSVLTINGEGPESTPQPLNCGEG